MEQIFDIIGIGIGPFNLGLAALCAPIKQLKCVFLDRKKSFNWHPGMLIPGATMQVSYLADLVTLADPANPFSYLKYLKHTGRLIQFGIYEHNYITRSEYNRYCMWVSNQLETLYYNQEVDNITHDPDTDYYTVSYKDVSNGKTYSITGKNIVIGIGSEPSIPSFARQVLGKRIFHSSDYEFHKKEMRSGKVVIIGAGQSAAEIFYDQLTGSMIEEKQISWFTRAPGFRCMENTKFAYELSTPEYIDYFFNLPESEKADLLRSQDYFYKGINDHLINSIYDILYERMAEGKDKNIMMMANTEATAIGRTSNGSWDINFCQIQQWKQFTHNADWVVLATGYHQAKPKFLSSLLPDTCHKSNKPVKISRDYLIEGLQGIYVQNGEINSHGFSAADLSLGAYRNAVIINSILQYSHFKIERKSTFQQFGI